MKRTTVWVDSAGNYHKNETSALSAEIRISLLKHFSEEQTDFIMNNWAIISSVIERAGNGHFNHEG